MNITIFGAGAYGTALGGILTANGHSVSYYDPIKFPGQSLSAVLNSADVNLLATPSDAIQKLILFIPHDKPLICASKGFLSMSPFYGFKDFSVLSGGAFAADLIAKKPVTLTATSQLVVDLFSNSWLTIELVRDSFGVLLCGALKNLYAIGSGYRGLSPDSPEFRNYIRLAHSELRLILAANGCNPSTADLACGFNDLVLTCSSTSSRNYRFGEQLRSDPALASNLASGAATLEQTTEGYATAQALASSSLEIPPEVSLLGEILKLVLPNA